MQRADECKRPVFWMSGPCTRISAISLEMIVSFSFCLVLLRNSDGQIYCLIRPMNMKQEEEQSLFLAKHTLSHLDLCLLLLSLWDTFSNVVELFHPPTRKKKKLSDKTFVNMLLTSLGFSSPSKDLAGKIQERVRMLKCSPIQLCPQTAFPSTDQFKPVLRRETEIWTFVWERCNWCVVGWETWMGKKTGEGKVKYLMHLFWKLCPPSFMFHRRSRGHILDMRDRGRTGSIFGCWSKVCLLPYTFWSMTLKYC